MNEAMDPDQPPRQISRWIAYPLLVVCPLAIILVGLKLGGLGYGERFMIASIESTPAENWVLSMLAICISTFAYVSRAFSNRSFRLSAMPFAFVMGCVVILFLFGAWGLYGLAAASALWFAYSWFIVRRRLKSMLNEVLKP